MSALFSNTLRDSLANDIIDGVVTIGLYTSNPGATNSGTEVTGGGYERQTATMTQSGNTLSNTAEITFGSLPSATITHYAIFLDDTFKVYGQLQNQIITESGDQAQLAVGTIEINIVGS